LYLPTILVFRFPDLEGYESVKYLDVPLATIETAFEEHFTKFVTNISISGLTFLVLFSYFFF